MSDDSLCIYKAGAKSVTLMASFVWNLPDFEDAVAAELNRIVRDGSIYILNDAVEQHYRKEKINKITLIEKNSIVSRRLNIAFPNYPTRAALSLKAKQKLIQLKAAPAQENLFLFAAAPSTEPFRKMLEAVRRSNCIIKEFCLLPVESVDLVDKIATKLNKESRQFKKAGWSIMIAQHHGGGLRQIVTKGGQIALTRITPVIQPEAENGAEWASEVVQEIQSTLSYLSRFGYNQEDGLDIILISKPELGTLVEDMINIPCQFSSLNLQRASDLAGVNAGRDQNQHYGDALHVAWFAKKSFHAMPMTSKEISVVSQPRKMALLGMFLMTAAFGYFAYSFVTEAQKYHANETNLVEVTAMKRTADRMYDDEIQRKQSLGIDVKLLQGSLAIFEEINDRSIDPLPVLEVVGRELRDLRINNLTMVSDGEAPAPIVTTETGDTTIAPPPQQNVRLLLSFNFPGTMLPQDGNAKLELFRQRLSKGLPGYRVVVSKELADLTYRGELTNETGLTAETRKAEDVYVGEIEITKEASDVADTGAQ